MRPKKGNEGGAQNRAQNKANDDEVAQKTALELGLVSRACPGDHGLGAAPEVADAHGRGKRTPVELPERLHLNPTGKRGQPVCPQAVTLGHQGNNRQNDDLNGKGELPPVQVLLARHELDDVAQRDAQGKADHRHRVVNALGPIAACQVHAKQKHVACLGIGKDVVSHQVGIAVHDSARERKKHGKLNGLRLLLGAIHAKCLSFSPLVFDRWSF